MDIWIIAITILILNLPFGYWRANVSKFSPQWLLSVHAPVPVAVALRVSTGLGWELMTFPVLVGAFSCGQFLGGRLHLWLGKSATTPVTSCLVWDLTKRIVRYFHPIINII